MIGIYVLRVLDGNISVAMSIMGLVAIIARVLLITRWNDLGGDVNQSLDSATAALRLISSQFPLTLLTCLFPRATPSLSEKTLILKSLQHPFLIHTLSLGSKSLASNGR